jgi:hypothetical protein
MRRRFAVWFGSQPHSYISFIGLVAQPHACSACVLPASGPFASPHAFCIVSVSDLLPPLLASPRGVLNPLPAIVILFSPAVDAAGKLVSLGSGKQRSRAAIGLVTACPQRNEAQRLPVPKMSEYQLAVLSSWHPCTANDCAPGLVSPCRTCWTGWLHGAVH